MWKDTTCLVSKDKDNMTPKEATLIVGGLSDTSKMPCKSYNTPAEACIKGSILRKVKGSVCADCYACKGHYVFSNVQNALTRRLLSLDHPKWIEAMTVLIKPMLFFRWHDSGDLQSALHLENIAEVCYNTANTKHWLPTREYGFVKEFWEEYGKVPIDILVPNLCIRLSGLMIDGKAPYQFARKLGVTISEVGRSKLVVTCPAHTQDNQCKDCRKCWKTNEFKVVYNYH